MEQMIFGRISPFNEILETLETFEQEFNRSAISG